MDANSVLSGPAAPTLPRAQRVLFVHTALRPPLGADTWIQAQLLKQLDRATHELHAACVRGPRQSPTPTFEILGEIPDLHLHPVDFGPELSGLSLPGKARALLGTIGAVAHGARLAVLIRRLEIPVIHTSDRPRDAFVCVLLARLTGAQCIIHAHVCYGEWMSPILKWSLMRADALVAVSAFVRGTLTASGHDGTRIHVVLNAIDPSEWQPGTSRDATRREFRVPLTAPVVITVCRLYPAKGPADLIRALAAVKQEHPDVRLWIVGQEMQTGFQQELRQLAQDLEVSENVLFIGYRKDVSRLMGGADIYAMPSFEEPFGLVFLEAMAMELPVVALNSGGTPEVVVDGVTGLLSEPSDIRQLAQHLSDLIGDPGRRATMGALGRRHVEAHFTTRRMAADVAAVYERVTRSRPPDTNIVERASLSALSSCDRQQLQRNLEDDGYSVIPGVVSKERLNEFHGHLMEAYQTAERFNGGGSISGHLNCFPGAGSRFIYDEIEEYGIGDAVRAMRSGRSNHVRPTLNFNLPGSKPQHYHMDGVYIEEFMICNIAVVDTELTNGAIDLLPSTNRSFYPFWKYALERKYRLTTRIPMKQGDVLLRKSTLWHRGMPNMTDIPRPMMSLTFGEKSAPEGDPFLANDGHISFYPNWYRTSKVGVIRERVEVAVPITRSTVRFVRSLVGNRGYATY